MSISFGPIYFVSTIVSGLTVDIVNSGPLGKTATFSWESTDIDGTPPKEWRVIINNTQTYLVKDNPIFSMPVPSAIFDKCKTCVRVQAIYPNGIITEYGDEICIKNIPHRYCNSRILRTTVGKKKKHSTFKGSQNMRYARAIKMGGKNAFR